jgi:hypothetical protein
MVVLGPRPVEASAAELASGWLTHLFDRHLPGDSLFKISEDGVFEGLGVVRPMLPWLPLARLSQGRRLP